METNWWDNLFGSSQDQNSVAGGVYGVLSSIFGEATPSGDASVAESSGMSETLPRTDENVGVDVQSRKGGKDFIKSTLDFIKNKESAPVLTLGALFIKGALDAPQKKRMADAAERSSQANALTATSQDERWRRQMDNASSIGKTNFGIMSSPEYKDLAAVRRQRSGGIM